MQAAAVFDPSKYKGFETLEFKIDPNTDGAVLTLAHLLYLHWQSYAQALSALTEGTLPPYSQMYFLQEETLQNQLYNTHNALCEMFVEILVREIGNDNWRWADVKSMLFATVAVNELPSSLPVLTFEVEKNHGRATFVIHRQGQEIFSSYVMLTW